MGRKKLDNGKIDRIALRVDRETHSILKKMARNEDRSLSATCARIIRLAVNPEYKKDNDDTL